MMQFRDLQKQYQSLKDEIDREIQTVLDSSNYISGSQVVELEEQLADYVGVKHCISCANGTDALQLALMAWDVGQGDAVFVPDFTFFSTGEVVCACQATPIFVDVDPVTYNMSAQSLEQAIEKVIAKGELTPKVVIPVDLFGQPADYDALLPIAQKYNMLVLEDGAQGFGGSIRNKKSGTFGDIATTSFFPAKPLGCYGDGGAIFTDNDEWAGLLRSYRIHGKGESKYDNVRIGMNSRLDTLQAAVLKVKLKAFAEVELDAVNRVAQQYTEGLKGQVVTPVVLQDFYSSWAQYTIQLKDSETRNTLQQFLKEKGIPSMIYYSKPMHLQKAFAYMDYSEYSFDVTNRLCDTVLSLPMHPYMTAEDVEVVVQAVKAL